DVPDQQTTKAQLEMTLDVMAHSLVYWVQDLHARGLHGEGSHVFAMTSSGGTRVMPFYWAVSAAKAAPEYHVRHLDLERGPEGRPLAACPAGGRPDQARAAAAPLLRRDAAHEAVGEAVRFALCVGPQHVVAELVVDGMDPLPFRVVLPPPLPALGVDQVDVAV